ncbi:MAG: hypothetical protein QOD35_2753 [Nocardioidaceae bacterium]|jgi:hypothetical protein|nr:hypothetical protein [Nocardioidaceae bacterium]
MNVTPDPSAALTPPAQAIGLAAVVFSALYFISDVLELLHGGFSTAQLVLTYVAEAAIPLFVIGLYAVQRPHIGRLGLLGAVAYAYAYVFFTGTVLLALVTHPRNWEALVRDLGPWVTVHGLLMVLAGSAFGVAVVRARVLPRWTGILLLVGVVLVALASPLPGAAQTLCAGVRDLAFAGMGLSLLPLPRPIRAPTERSVVHVHA